MSRWVYATLIALGLLSAGAAQADNGPSQTYYAPSGAAPFVPWNGTTTASPSPTTYQGTMTLAAATSTSLVAANVTMSNSTVLPLAGAFAKTFVLNTGVTNSVYVCWFGGTCSATAGGELLLPGASDTKNLTGVAAAPTFYSVSGTTLAFSN